MFVLDHPGGFPIGATTFGLRLPEPIAVGEVKLRTDPTQKALEANKLVFTAYYPTTSTKRAGSSLERWLHHPLHLSWKSYSHMLGLEGWRSYALWPVVYFYGRFIKIPVYSSAPLLDPEEPWPLVIFSHGLFGSRTAYSQICTRIAADGYVVLALEHQDGSGVVCTPFEDAGKERHFYRMKDIIFEEPSQDDSIRFRREQLTFRKLEIEAVHSAFSEMIKEGASTCLSPTVSHQPEGTFSPSQWLNKVDTANVSLVGHSFGGCTVLSMLMSEPPQPTKAFDVWKAIILDPWIDPLPEPEEREASRISQPLLVVNSEPFTLWTEHYERLKRLLSPSQEGPGTKIATIAASEHISFSDYHLLPFVHILKGKAPRRFMSTFAMLCTSFLQDTLHLEWETSPPKKLEISQHENLKDEYGEPKRKLVAQVGDTILD